MYVVALVIFNKAFDSQNNCKKFFFTPLCHVSKTLDVDGDITIEPVVIPETQSDVNRVIRATP